MSTATVTTRGFPRRTRQTLARERFLRRRRSLAGVVEGALDPRFPQRHGLRPWPRIPHANRAAVLEPLQRIAVLLRDPAITVPDRTLRRVMGFVTDPASPAYGTVSEPGRLRCPLATRRGVCALAPPRGLRTGFESRVRGRGAANAPPLSRPVLSVMRCALPHRSEIGTGARRAASSSQVSWT